MPINTRIIRNIAQTGSNKPLGIEREHGRTGAVTGIVQHATTPFKGKILQFLSNVPLLKELPAVRAYVKKTRVNNQLLLTQFILSLAEIEKKSGKLVNETTLLAAAEALQEMKLNRPLSGRDVKVMTDRMADFYGIGDAKDLPRKVQVNIWPYGENIGHASITVNNDNAANTPTYISWWPKVISDGSTYDYFFKQHRVDESENYQHDARNEISTRTEYKLDSFDIKSSLQRKKGGLSKNFSENLLTIINEEMSEIFRICKETLASARHNNADFLALLPHEQKKILTDYITDHMNNRSTTTKKSQNISEAAQIAFRDKILNAITNTMLDLALGLSKKEIS